MAMSKAKSKNDPFGALTTVDLPEGRTGFYRPSRLVVGRRPCEGHGREGHDREHAAQSDRRSDLTPERSGLRGEAVNARGPAAAPRCDGMKWSGAWI